MGTILEYPKPLLSFLNVFRSNLSKPQFNNFLQITNGIALSYHFTISRISQMFEYRDNSSLNKFLTQSPWKEEPIKTKILKN